MGYKVSALQLLEALLKDTPPNGSILELGQQNIEPDVPREAVLSCARAIHGPGKKAEEAASLYDGVNRLPVSELFRGSGYHYRCLDLYPGEFTIAADLNTFSVAPADRGRFDLVTNFGTTEHVTDQVNAFRVIHDFCKPGGRFIHIVPFTGFLNHGLYNYQPVFFVFMSAANQYEIITLNFSPPDFPYTIPDIKGIRGCDTWQGIRIDSGDIGCYLRKTADAPFRLFTDFDQAVMGKMALPEPWAEMVRDRYKLGIHAPAAT